MKAGIVGLPNVGKSTLFNLLTQSEKAIAADYPFCTIEPNIAKVPNYDERLDNVAKQYGSAKTIYSDLEFYDIAGLIRGASKGEGLGNQFLSHISEVNLIIHLVRCFGGSVTHVENRVDPVADLETILDELRLYDLQKLDRLKEKNKKYPDKLALLQKAEKYIMECIQTTDSFIIECNFLTLKPFIVVGNGKDVSVLEKYCQDKNYIFTKLCVESLEFGEGGDELSQLIRIAYDKLDLITYFTAGEKEARAWRVKKDSPAPIAAGEIHTDFIKHFIRAEVIPYSKFIIVDNVKQLKPDVKGKDYLVQDADIIHFLIGR